MSLFFELGFHGADEGQEVRENFRDFRPKACSLSSLPQMGRDSNPACRT